MHIYMYTHVQTLPRTHNNTEHRKPHWYKADYNQQFEMKLPHANIVQRIRNSVVVQVNIFPCT